MAALVLMVATVGYAQALRVELDAPASLRAGDRTTVELRVWAEDERPVMVTPRAEGDAVEVVRGRLLRPDAVDPGATPLVFRIPIAAREPGPARVRVEVHSFTCEGDECRPVEGEAQLDLRVSR
ncbi:MAG: hypothetical protein JJ863_18620 [Deltaproteobacteria bacterium]|nr:hypothetical protein [Deltaproteobacteria bacterium]